MGQEESNINYNYEKFHLICFGFRPGHDDVLAGSTVMKEVSFRLPKHHKKYQKNIKTHQQAASLRCTYSGHHVPIAVSISRSILLDQHWPKIDARKRKSSNHLVESRHNILVSLLMFGYWTDRRYNGNEIFGETKIHELFVTSDDAIQFGTVQYVYCAYVDDQPRISGQSTVVHSPECILDS